ncbi:hypothetical protein [Myroides sp. WP-1]|uniref:hypothetical protein n=1 Tax=Myroides sp. WP-1 TaxID=2759944 RepID=UPI0015FB8FDD|nr:hypothetical protein [Myroides sp. WP-1]MBB1139166.1 hypothetical protein [Myroides sp. WP-1]
MRNKIIITSLLLGICIACNSKNTKPEEQQQPALVNQTTQAETIAKTTPEEEIKLIGTSPELYAESEEKMLNMLNEPDQMRLQKAIQIVSNKIGESEDLYTEEDDIDYDKWNAIFFKQVHGLTFTGITNLAEQILQEIKNKNILHLQEEIADLKTNPTENQEESMSFLQEELQKAKQLPTTIDTYVYSEECFL